MATVVFYEKPGCINNTRQKQLLNEAGHVVDARNLLTTDWQVDELRSYFSGMPFTEWFNPSAPAIKSGEVVPAELDEEQTLVLMQRDPLLIRRPLMKVGNARRAGFNADDINKWIGLSASAEKDSTTLETCPRLDNHRCDITPGKPA
jgi:nitrogenase-associated protein